MSIEKVELEIGNKKHACTGHVMSCNETGRTIASFWHEHDAVDAAMKINSHDMMFDFIQKIAGHTSFAGNDAKRILNEINGNCGK